MIVGLARDHFPLVVTAVLILAYSVRVLMIARGQADVARTVLLTQGLTGFLSAVVDLVDRIAEQWWALPLMFAFVVLVEWSLASFESVIERIWRLFGRDPPARSFYFRRPGGREVLFTILLAVFTPTVANSEPWMAREMVILGTNGDRGCVGWTLGEQGDGRWLVFLTYNDRRVVFIDTQDVTVRISLTPSPSAEQLAAIDALLVEAPGDAAVLDLGADDVEPTNRTIADLMQQACPIASRRAVTGSPVIGGAGATQGY